MKQITFENQFTKEWQDFELLLQNLEANRFKRRKLITQIKDVTFSRRYRRLCHYLSLAKERGYSNRLIQYLNSLVLRGHAQLYHHKATPFFKVWLFFIFEFPSLIRKEAKITLMAAALFLVPVILLATFTYIIPDLIYSVFSPENVKQYESMYENASNLTQSRKADSDFAMFGFYIFNNIGIGFRCFAGGILFGLGSVFFLIFNGVIMGAITGHMINLDYATTFFSFVIGHGSFELTAIVLSGAAGLKIGISLIAPGRYSRMDALKQSSVISIKMVYGIIVMLVIAAFIEAFWSSLVYPPIVKFIVGGILWGLIFFYFLFSGRRRGSQSN